MDNIALLRYRFKMTNTQLIPRTSPEVFTGLLLDHALTSAKTSPTNASYAQSVSENAERVQALLETGEGQVTNVVSTWRDNFRPIAEALFGGEFPTTNELYGLRESHGDFGPTVFTGVLGRVSIVSVDEIMGACLTLDLRAVDPYAQIVQD